MAARRPVILCIDDYESALVGRQMLLEEEGYEVLTAADGRREPFEAALLEYDPSKLPERIAVALEAIHRRLLQLRGTPSREEHDKIEDALRTLFNLQERRA
jgi:CheY-like chemotaxis protein